MDPTIEKFAVQMARILKTNQQKGGWKDCSPVYLAMRLVQEVGELYGYIMQCQEEKADGNLTPYTVRCLLNECCDVANFAMMVADVVGALEDTDSQQQEKL